MFLFLISHDDCFSDDDDDDDVLGISHGEKLQKCLNPPTGRWMIWLR